MELGTYKSQGLDYVYTLQGWLKGVNSETLKENRDIGKDGNNSTANLNKYVAPDQYAYSLGYFAGDYSAINGPSNNWLASRGSSSPLVTNTNDLYNGNISTMVTGIRHFMQGSSDQLFANSYSYDQLNRLTKVRVYNGNSVVSGNSWDGATHTENYGENLSYDKNGNILSLTRNANDNSSGTFDAMDNLTYNYENGDANNKPLFTNKLMSVQDASDIPAITSDIKPGQDISNYSYDDIGNLIEDVQEEIENIEWTVYGKVKRITRIAQSTKPDLEFGYDPAGNRIRKTVINKTGGSLFARTNNYYYLRDAQGNIMATYSLIGTETGNEVERTLAIDESSIYGSSRLGSLKREQWIARNAYDLTTGTPIATGYSTFEPDPNVKDQFRGDKNYELSNHLGNVLVTVSDRRTPEYTLGAFSRFNANVSSAQDYYSFGMIQPGRSFGSTVYPFGYNAGSEKDDEISGVTGSHYYTLFRELDTRIGRWWAIDPKTTLTPWESPYSSMGNNPIWFNDPLGDVKTKYVDEKGELILDTDDGSNDVIVVQGKNAENFKKIVSLQSKGDKKPQGECNLNKKGFNDYWRTEFGGTPLKTAKTHWEQRADGVHADVINWLNYEDESIRQSMNPNSSNLGDLLLKWWVGEVVNPLNYGPSPIKVPYLKNSPTKTVMQNHTYPKNSFVGKPKGAFMQTVVKDHQIKVGRVNAMRQAVGAAVDKLNNNKPKETEND